MHVPTAVRLLPGTVVPNQDRRVPTWVSAYSALNGAIAREINRRCFEDAARPFARKGKLLRCFCEVFLCFLLGYRRKSSRAMGQHDQKFVGGLEAVQPVRALF